MQLQPGAAVTVALTCISPRQYIVIPSKWQVTELNRKRIVPTPD
jgi:hypothetical protein